jgi:hypothetical protein
MERKRALIDNKLSREKIVAAQEPFDGKKERSRKLNKTVNKNAAEILSNIATKIPYTITTNNFEDVGMVTTTSIIL